VSTSVARNRWRLAVRLTAAALIWSLGLVVAAALVPTYGGQTVSNSDGLTLTARTAVQVHGLKAVIVVAVPVVMTLVVAWALYRRRLDDWRFSGPVAWTAIVVVAMVAVLGIPSVGLFMLPVAVLLALAARLVVGPQGVRPEPARPG
jgi:uncharacterized membrane protein YhaH (DUF805 family)